MPLDALLPWGLVLRSGNCHPRSLTVAAITAGFRVEIGGNCAPVDW